MSNFPFTLAAGWMPIDLATGSSPFPSAANPARVALQEGNRTARIRSGSLRSHGVVGRRHAAGVEEILELAQPPGAQLGRFPIGARQ